MHFSELCINQSKYVRYPRLKLTWVKYTIVFECRCFLLHFPELVWCFGTHEIFLTFYLGDTFIQNKLLSNYLF